MRSKVWLAVPVLLAHAEVAKNIILFSMGPKLRHPMVLYLEMRGQHCYCMRIRVLSLCPLITGIPFSMPPLDASSLPAPPSHIPGTAPPPFMAPPATAPASEEAAPSLPGGGKQHTPRFSSCLNPFCAVCPTDACFLNTFLPFLRLLCLQRLISKR